MNIYKCIFVKEGDFVEWRLDKSQEKFLQYLIENNYFRDGLIIDKIKEVIKND